MTRIIVITVQIVGGIIESTLFFRFIFELFNADRTGLVSSLYDFTQPLVSPFTVIPRITAGGGNVIDFSIIGAMIAYAVAWYLLVELALLIGNSLSKK
ncbi:YggT family protein [Candidatus Berkelbacteria bacterium]|nr:YggT family protein [Candidatus Berkelbacteria bacterium]